MMEGAGDVVGRGRLRFCEEPGKEDSEPMGTQGENDWSLGGDQTRS